MKEKISKFINVAKRDGLKSTIRKTSKYINANYINKINIDKRLKYNMINKKLSIYLDKLLKKNNYDRIIIWRGSFGWDVPLYQRPQQIANMLSDKRCLIFYEVTRMTDDVDFILKEKENLYLVNYEIDSFVKLLFNKIININKPKYLQLYSTCWDVKKKH